MAEGKERLIYVKTGAFDFSFSEDEIINADIIATAPGSFNIIRNGRSVNVHVVSVSTDGKDITAEAEGERFELQIRDGLDQMLDTMGFNSVSAKQVKEVKAPMPGLVLDISVGEGDELEEGDRILILEAMKMENSIVMHAKGRVKKVNVKKGQAVEKGQVLIEID